MRHPLSKFLHYSAKFTAATCLTAFLVSGGCSSENTVVEPDPPGEEFTLVASDTIGSAGGSVVTDHFSLTVPAGAYVSDHVIRVFVSEDTRRYGADQVSRTWRLEGARSYALPLGVSLRYQGALSEDSYIVLETAVSDTPVRFGVPAITLAPVGVADGLLSATLPMAPTTSVSIGGSNTPADDGMLLDVIYLMGISGQLKAVLAAPAPIKILYPANLFPRRDALVQALFDCRQLFHDVGPAVISLPVCGGPWSVEDTAYVLVRPGGKDTRSGGIGRQMVAPVDRTLYFLWLNSDRVGEWSDDQLKVETISLYWLLAQSWNDAQFDRNDRFWLHRAFSLSVESLFATTPPHVPGMFRGRELSPFYGPRAASLGWIESDSYGRGMAPLARYIMKEKGRSVVEAICGEMCRQDHNGVEAILKNVGADASLWLPDFFRWYVDGKIFEVDPGTFLGNLSGIFLVNGPADTLHTFSDPFNDLSARIYMVGLRYDDIDAAATIRFTAGTTGVEKRDVVVFGYKGGDLEFLVRGDHVVLPQTVKTLMNEGYSELVAVVVNDGYDAPAFDGETDIELDVRIDVPASPAYPYVYFTAIAFSEARYVSSVGSSYWSTGTFTIDGPGTFDGNVFSGSWHEYDDGYFLRNGQVIVTVGADAQSIASFEVSDTLYYETERIILEIAGGGTVHRTETGLRYISFDLEGDVISSHVSHLFWRSDDPPAWEYLAEYRFSEFSTLELMFMTYDPNAGNAGPGVRRPSGR